MNFFHQQRHKNNNGTKGQQCKHMLISREKKKGKGKMKTNYYTLPQSVKEKNARAMSGVGLLLRQRFENSIKT